MKPEKDAATREKLKQELYSAKKIGDCEFAKVECECGDTWLALSECPLYGTKEKIHYEEKDFVLNCSCGKEYKFHQDKHGNIKHREDK